MHIRVKNWFFIEGHPSQLHRLTFLKCRNQEIAPTERVDNRHGVLIVADEAPVGGDLRGNRFGFNAINNVADVSLKGFCFKMGFSKRAEGIHAEHNLVSVFTKHQSKRIELTIKRTNRVDGAVAGFWVKKGTDVKIFVRF